MYSRKARWWLKRDFAVDFSHEGSLNREELIEIEKVVGEQVRMNTAVDVSLMPYKQAISSGLLLFLERNMLRK